MNALTGLIGSKEVARAAIEISLTSTRVEEKKVQERLMASGILSVAVDFGGEYVSSVMKVVERAVVGSKRENVIVGTHLEEGAVAGATRDALGQIMPKALGCNFGGKIGIARYEDHVSVSVFAGIGLLHLNEVAIGLGHRVL
ncbi:MAG: HutP family protein [Clostridia bacterium]